MAKPTLNPALKDFWTTKSRVKVLYGGRASSKTWDASGVAVFLSQKYKIKFLCTRQFQNRISESVYATIKAQIERFGLSEQFTVTNNKIVNNNTGSEFIFLGLWRNIDEIKSLEGVDICWIEEAHSLTKEQWDVLEPTVRKQGSEFWIVFNPKLRTDYVYKTFVLGNMPDTVKRKINYDENPFLSDTMLKLIENKKNESLDEYDHIYRGIPRTEATNSLFNYKDLEQMTNEKRIIDDSGTSVFGCDIARFGDDKTIIFARKGYKGQFFREYEKQDTMTTASCIIGEFNSIYEKPDYLFVDTIGVGAGVYDRLVQLGLSSQSIEANASMKATNPIYFNKRTEMYHNLRDAIQKGLYVPPDEDLEEELMAITYSITSDGKVKLCSKDEIKESIGRSPDKSDAVALSYFENLPAQEYTKNDYAQSTYTQMPKGAW